MKIQDPNRTDDTVCNIKCKNPEHRICVIGDEKKQWLYMALPFDTYEAAVIRDNIASDGRLYLYVELDTEDDDASS